jgi:dihydrodipicolinate synthase/N-acetylneuraminate lyase
VTSSADLARARRQLLAELFPDGVPSLWCPPLTHYDAEGRIDAQRMARHLESISPWVKGLLVPGTTGDGWELTATEARTVIDVVLQAAQRLDLQVLLGVLHPAADQACQAIQRIVDRLRRSDPGEAIRGLLRHHHVCGFAVCPPRGRDVPPQRMAADLATILELDVPIALYQLPQLTENEMAPELVRDLAQRYANLILFKDTSGADRVALSGVDLGGLFLVRGAEEDYARWLRSGGGCYDGFLLSTANVMAEDLSEVCQRLDRGQVEEARQLSTRLTGAVRELFQIAESATGGNPFANANKLADHFRAYGPRAAEVPPPRLHSGWGLTADMVRASGEVLTRYELMPAQGYLD